MVVEYLKRMVGTKRFSSPAFIVLKWFGPCILLGTVLLWLPWSHTDAGPEVGFSTALFTAASAACVTGLSVVNVADAFSWFGQLVLLALLELGGLGVMTFAHLGFRLFGYRASLTHQAATADSLFQNDAAREFARSFRRILRLTLMIQAVGAVLMLTALAPRAVRGETGWPFTVWSAVFHAVSAFCNGGFSIYRDQVNGFLDNIPFLSIILVLITLGGLGHTVLVELHRLPKLIGGSEKRVHWLSLHSRVVLVMTALLIVGGFLALYVLGVGGQASRLGGAAFQSISCRTAGFNTVPIQAMPLASILVLVTLMFIGGSPGSCAGGIKTTSLAIWFARIKANLRNDSNVSLFGYTIAPDLVSRARILMALTMLWNLAGVFILVLIHPGERLETLIFEQVSAFGTVGLTMDFTPRLTELSRLWIILSMVVGRLGPLTLVLWVVPTVKAKIGRPLARIMVG
jgi:trk system potassium uptake protein TrkH